MLEILKRKLTIKVTKDIDIRPYIPASNKLLEILLKLNNFLYVIPFKIIIKHDSELINCEIISHSF